MIRLEDICYIKQNGWKVKIKKRATNEIELKGQVFSDKKIIEIYLWNIDNQKDFEITLLHEFQHVYDLIDFFEMENYELLTEQKARTLYNDFPEVLREIKKEYPHTRGVV